jgi:serine protease Do
MPLRTIVLLSVLTAAGAAPAPPAAWLGVTYGPPERTAAKEETPGALVTAVVRDGPADRAGIRAGDIVVRVGNAPVALAADLPAAVARQATDGWVEVELLRRGDRRTVSLRLLERPEDARARELRRGSIGITLLDVPVQLRERWGGSEGRGVLVGEVRPGGPAERAGIQPGDLVLEIDGRDVPNAEELGRRVQLGGVGNRLPMLASRQGTILEVLVDVEDAPPRARNQRN